MTLAEIARYRLINQQFADTKIKSAVIANIRYCHN